jgi:lysophospholipase L1-like esterase
LTLPDDLSARTYADIAAIVAAPPDWQIDFTRLGSTLPAEVTSSAPSLSSRGLYVSNSNQSAVVNLAAVISGFTGADWTVEVDFECEAPTTVSQGRIPVQIAVNNVNRAALGFSDADGSMTVNWSNVTNDPSLLVQSNNGIATINGYGRRNRFMFGTTGGLGFAVVNGLIVMTGQAQRAMTTAPSLHLGGARTLSEAWLFGWIRSVRVWKTAVAAARQIVNAPSPDLRLSTWGDSLTAGAGASPATRAYPQMLGRLANRQVRNGGIGGDTSTQIRTRFFAAATYLRDWTQVFWCGRNNPSATSTVVGDVQAMVNTLPHGRFLVLSILNRSDGTENTGSTALNNILATNAALAAAFPAQYVDIRSRLVSASGGTGDAPAASTSADGLHLNNQWYEWVAGQVRDELAARGWS